MNKLRELRKEKGDTQEVVAKAMGVTRRGYQKWENEESQIKPDKAQQLAENPNHDDRVAIREVCMELIEATLEGY